MEKDYIKLGATGEVHDTIRFIEDGEVELSNGEVIKGKVGDEIKLPVVYNLIVDSLPKIIASLIKGDSTYFQNMWWEVGSGSESWVDTDLPSPRITDTGLMNPFFRKSIKPTQVNYINPTTNEISKTVTNKIQLECTFAPSEANGYLREFSIFVGGTSALGSGLPINRKIHGVIFKTSGIELQRKIHFQFNI